MASRPHVYMNGTEITDFSENGNLTQKNIRQCRDFKILDSEQEIVGFHDHPNEMWISEHYMSFAVKCESEGWIKIEGPAS